VLELPCGVISDSQMQVGDQLQISFISGGNPAAANDIS
jgi:uncharacterized membrane protein (UPF0127 family)